MSHFLFRVLACLFVPVACPAQTPSWTLAKPIASPSSRGYHVMAYDSARQRTVLHGGFDGAAVLTDTWEFDGNTWTMMRPKVAPPAASQYAMAYDSVRQRTVLFGGATFAGNLDETWEWDGVNWTRAKFTRSPPARYNHAMAYDSARQRMVMFGGNTNLASPRFHGDTWEWGMKLGLTANTSTISFATGGSQQFTLSAGVALRNKPYCMFGSITGSMPGVMLTGIHIPLNPDHYTSLIVQVGNSKEFAGFKGVLSATGTATASLNVPRGLPAVPTTLNHAFVVYDGGTNQVFTASNPVPVHLR